MRTDIPPELSRRCALPIDAMTFCHFAGPCVGASPRRDVSASRHRNSIDNATASREDADMRLKPRSTHRHHADRAQGWFGSTGHALPFKTSASLGPALEDRQSPDRAAFRDVGTDRLRQSTGADLREPPAAPVVPVSKDRPIAELVT